MKNIFILLIFSVMSLIGSLSIRADRFQNAKWIGVPSDHLPLNSNYLSVFDLEFDLLIEGKDTVSFIYGLNDPRLLNSNENIFNISNPVDSSYIKIRFDGLDSVEIFRKGYHPMDSLNLPIVKFDKSNLKRGENKIKISSNSGITTFVINDEKIGNSFLNPYGTRGDCFAFPVLADVAVEVSEGSSSKIGNIKIKNHREPRNTIFTLEGYFDKDNKISLPVRSMPELKTILEVPDKSDLISAEITATARGIYDIYINGKVVSDGYFYPGSTQYNKSHLYHSFDLLPFLESGNNEIKVSLGEGWWSGASTFSTANWNFFGDRQSFISEIILKYKDGSSEIFYTSPEEWEYSVDGPLLEASFFNGEIFDNSRKQKKQTWRPAVEVGIDSTVNKNVGSWSEINYLPSFGDKVISVDTLRAMQLYEPRKGVYVYDMGQNFAGVPFIEFSKLKPRQEVTIRYAEMLYPDMPQYEPNVGLIMTENLREAMNKDSFISSGEEKEIFSPRMTLHGYRYIEITGIEEPLSLDQVKGLPLSSVHNITAHFECSDTLVNRLWENIIWSTRSNFISIPTDCPQRNERLGWMGDISVFSPTATKIADVSSLLQQYLVSIRDCQLENGRYPDVAPTGTGFGGLLWGSAGIVVPLENYKRYNDKKSLKEHNPSMKKYIDYILNETIDPASNVIVQNREWGDLGDWLSPEYDKNDKSLLWECYFIYDLGLMEKSALILGLDEDAEFYNSLKRDRKKHFIETYVDKKSGKTIWSDFDKNKKGKEIDTQISYALPLAFEIYSSPEFIDNFIKTIIRTNTADDNTLCPPYSLMTGFIGTAWISEALSKIGREDLAYKLLTNTSYPSWLYPVTQGATTIWERLNSFTHKDGFGNNNSMNSFNHYSFGSVGNWLLTRSLGINETDEDIIIISPQPDPGRNITWAKGYLDTNNGRVESGWKVEGDNLTIDIFLPEGQEGFLVYGGENKKLRSGNQKYSFIYDK